MKLRGFAIYITLLFCAFTTEVIAQEMVAPLYYNSVLQGRKKVMKAQYKSTAISLPLFEDFTGYSPYPDSNLWADRQVYVNNGMGRSPISRGVATFDAINEVGYPYDTINKFTLLRADSLTIKPIDISTLTPSDSVYLSFFFQPQGKGFEPEAADSLMLFFKKSNGTWVKAWGAEGDYAYHFKQAMVVLTDVDYFHSAFQFRFVNKASIGVTDDVWNVDYIRMNSGRTFNDTAVNDVAFTSDPSFMLNDYTYMPYRHFLANANGERSTDITDSVRNNYNFQQNVNVHFTARELSTSTPLTISGPVNLALPPYLIQPTSVSTYTNTIPLPSNVQDFVCFENKFYIESVGANDSKGNDTVVKHQVFDNYFAYDDGTAEMAYYLNLSANLPGKIAIDYHLNEPDVLQGVSIYFGRQVTLGTNKTFSIVVYKKLQGIDGSVQDELLMQQDLMFPHYLPVNGFYNYQIDNPVSLPAGQFYIGIIQPAFSGSDSLYVGLDRNRVQGNHAYYNVQDQWIESQVSGALMIRPLVGQIVFDTGLDFVGTGKKDINFNIYPNPATDHVICNYQGNQEATYYITDIQGRTLLKDVLQADKNVNVSTLTPGIYLVRIKSNGVISAPQKFIKQ
jgi:hypothetical protein